MGGIMIWIVSAYLVAGALVLAWIIYVDAPYDVAVEDLFFLPIAWAMWPLMLILALAFWASETKFFSKRVFSMHKGRWHRTKHL